MTLQENLAGARIGVRALQLRRRFETANRNLMETAVRASSLVAGWGADDAPREPGRGGCALVGRHLVTPARCRWGRSSPSRTTWRRCSALMMVGMLLMQLTRADASADRSSSAETEPTVRDAPDTQRPQ